MVFRAVLRWVEDHPKERLPFLSSLLFRVRFSLFSSSELQEALSCSLVYRRSGAERAVQTLQSLLGGDYRGTECRPRTPNQVKHIHPCQDSLLMLTFHQELNMFETARFKIQLSSRFRFWFWLEEILLTMSSWRGFLARPCGLLSGSIVGPA